MDNSKGV